MMLRKLRIERALSQADLARMTGSTQATISALEGGKRTARHKTIRQLAEALDVEPREILAKGESDA